MVDNDGPPQDLGAERQLLGALLAAPGSIDQVTELVDAGDFYRPAHETVYAAILAQHAAGEPVDPKLIGERLRVAGELQRVGGLPFLHSLIQNLLTASNVSYYAEIVARCSAQRALLRAGQRITQLASAEDVDDMGDLQARARQELDTAVNRRSRDEIVWAHESMVDTIEVLSDPPEVWSSPWSDLDQYIGGAAPGRLYVIGARPAVGKTVLGLQWAAWHAAKHDQAVLYFTLEMSRREIDLRLLAQTARVDYSSLNAHHLTEQDWERVASVQGKLAALPLSVVDRPNMRIDDIRRVARTVAKSRRLGMIAVDYLQLMAHPDLRMPRQQQVADFSRSLKLLSRELGIPVVAMSQLNRASEHRRSGMPGMSDLRESGAVEQDSDVVILLHRNTEEPEKAHDLSALVAKNRFGPPGGLRLRFQGHFQRIEQTAWRPTDVLDSMPQTG
jgi:replicative DNA helicase